MKEKLITISLIAFALFTPFVYCDETSPVIEVSVYKIAGSVSDFIEWVDEAGKVYEEIWPEDNVTKVSTYMATAAGDETGIITVIVEYPSLLDWARGEQVVTPHPKWQDLLVKSEQQGFKLLSQSLHFQISSYSPPKNQ